MNKYREREAEITSSAAVMSENVALLKTEQAGLMRSFNQTRSSVMKRKIEEQVEDLEVQVNKATQKRDEIEVEEHDTRSFVRYAKDLMEHPAKMLGNNSNPIVQR